ncbi:hypothetical protein [Sinorhizobium fredii]|uniref:hypothetical protein n=1 Tax=Rhizobium fredii TaxID=380 RepID=UPI003516DDE0
MEPADGAAPAGSPEEITFANLPEWYDLFCTCRRCGRESRIDRRALARRFGKRQPILALARHMRCRKCMNKDGNTIVVGKVRR